MMTKIARQETTAARQPSDRSGQDVAEGERHGRVAEGCLPPTVFDGVADVGKGQRGDRSGGSSGEETKGIKGVEIRRKRAQSSVPIVAAPIATVMTCTRPSRSASGP